LQHDGRGVVKVEAQYVCSLLPDTIADADGDAADVAYESSLMNGQIWKVESTVY
jgi:hypothetical protein